MSIRARRLFALAGLLAVAVGLGACNTVRGIGQDVRAAGEALSGTAERTQEEITE